MTGTMRAAGGVMLALAAVLVLSRREGHWTRWVGASTHHLLYDAAVLVVTGVLATGARVAPRRPT